MKRSQKQLPPPDQPDHPWYFITDAAVDEPLPLTHNQTPIRKVVIDDEDDVVVKRTDCKWYGECLDHTACQDWDQWSCAGCDAYEADQDSEDPFVHIRFRVEDPADLTFGGDDSWGLDSSSESGD